MYFHLCYYHICEQVWLIHWLLCVAGLSMAVRHESLYSGLSGFNGALGCMAVGGFFIFSLWTDLFAIASGNTDTQTHTGTVIICCLKYLMAVKWRCSYITNDVRWHLSTNLFWGMLFSCHCVYSNMHNSFRLRKSALPNKYLGYQECGGKSDKWNMWSYLLWWRLLDKRTA